MSRTALARLVATASVALVTTGAAFVSFGPPWISIETPPNPLDRSYRGAYLVVHTYHHDTPVGAAVTGTAEGIVGGARRTLRLTFDTTSRRGSYALRKQWPNDGTWMLVINTGGMREGATALVDVAPTGEVAGVRVPTRRHGDVDVPAPVTAQDVELAMQARVSRQSAGASRQ